MERTKILNFGSVGTSSIMRVMQEAIRLTDGTVSKLLYSRSAERGRDFAQSEGIPESCDSYDAMLARNDLDVIYIASPNRFHTDQALKALNAGKHVIVEKPTAVTAEEVRALYEAANANHVFFFEAITTLFMPNFLACKQLLSQLGPLHSARLAYGQYSSKYDAYLRGENPNVFNPDMQGGVLNDMGIYCVHAAVNLLGEPESVRYEAERGPNGVDLSGTLTLKYPALTCEITMAKDRSLESGCRFEGEHGYFEERGPLNDFVRCSAALNGMVQEINVQSDGNRMLYELARFRDAILEGDADFFAAMAKQSILAASVLEQAHRCI